MSPKALRNRYLRQNQPIQRCLPGLSLERSGFYLPIAGLGLVFLAWNQLSVNSKTRDLLGISLA